MRKFRIVYRNTSIDAPEGEFLVGRNEDCNLVLDDPSVSRVHFALVRNGDQLYAEDRGSRNGIKVNGIKIEERVPLGDGDHIEVGHQTILIHAVTKVEEGEKTIGLSICRSCGTWMPSNEMVCHNCGTPRQSAAPNSPVADDTDSRVTSVGETGQVDQIAMLSELAQKAVRVSKLDEAERLLLTALQNVAERLNKNETISDYPLNTLGNALLDLALAAKSGAYISELFRLYRRVKRLCSRELVERLYEAVRPVGYRSCPEMADYIAYIKQQSNAFSPGERFIGRRIEGLVKLCS